MGCSVFKRIRLDITNFKAMAPQHNEVIMWAHGDQLANLMVDGSKVEELAVASEWDLSKVDHVHMRE